MNLIDFLFKKKNKKIEVSENLKLNEIPTYLLMYELSNRGLKEEADLTLINSRLSKYGISIEPAPVHSGESVTVNYSTPRSIL